MRISLLNFLPFLIVALTHGFAPSLILPCATTTLIHRQSSNGHAVIHGVATPLLKPEKKKSRNKLDARRWIPYREIHEWAGNSVRPKKKKVGVHSMLSQVAVGVALVTFLPMFAPCLSLNVLKLQFFDIYGANLSPLASIGQMNFCSVLLLLVAGLGHLRFPPNTIKTRKMMFETITAGIVHLVAMSLSNVSGASGAALFCAWSTIGRILLSATCMGVCVMTSLSFYEIITKPPCVANVFFETRIRGLFSASAYLFSFYSFYAVLMFQIFGTKQAFLFGTQRLFEASGLTLFTETYIRSMNIFYLSMGAFYSTLQFEKRVPMRVTNVLLAATAFFLLFDMYKFHFLFFRAANMGLNPEAAVLSNLVQIRNKYHLRAIFWSPPVVAVVTGVLKVVRTQLCDKSLSAAAQDEN